MKIDVSCTALRVAIASAAVMALAGPSANAAGFSGNLGVVSKYVLRGISNNAESDDPALQAGLKYDFGGPYVAWWGSSLDYASTTDSPATTRGFENDFIAGYSTAIGSLTLDAGLTYYVYQDIDDSDALEPYANLTAGPVTLGVKYLAEDVVWGNSGDTYMTATYAQKLPSDFNFTAVAGFYRYAKSGDFEGTAFTTTQSSGFRHLDLTLSHPLGKTGFDVAVTFVLGGEDRAGVDQANTTVIGLSTVF